MAPRLLQLVYVENCVWGFGAVAREALECCQQSLTAILVGDWKARMLREMQIAEPMRFQSPEGFRGHSYYILAKIWLCAKNLSNTEFKSK